MGRTSDEDRQKAQEMSDQMATAIGLNDAAKKTVASFLGGALSRMENEDPYRLMPCCCCGDMWEAGELDVFGYHYPYSKILLSPGNVAGQKGEKNV